MIFKSVSTMNFNYLKKIHIKLTGFETVSSFLFNSFFGLLYKEVMIIITYIVNYCKQIIYEMLITE